jgi:hypothetical protein
MLHFAVLNCQQPQSATHQSIPFYPQIPNWPVQPAHAPTCPLFEKRAGKRRAGQKKRKGRFPFLRPRQARFELCICLVTRQFTVHHLEVMILLFCSLGLSSANQSGLSSTCRRKLANYTSFEPTSLSSCPSLHDRVGGRITSDNGAAVPYPLKGTMYQET